MKQIQGYGIEILYVVGFIAISGLIMSLVMLL